MIKPTAREQERAGSKIRKSGNQTCEQELQNKAVMAQSAEHVLGKDEVPGSNPGNSSTVGKTAQICNDARLSCCPPIGSVVCVQKAELSQARGENNG